MLPEGYDQFFVAAATVAGALIGLLFVAVSVRPEAARRAAHITTRLRAVAALSAFLDTLFLSLLALRPRPQLGSVALTLAAVGLVAMVTLLLLLVSDRRDRAWPRLRGAVLVVGQGVMYVLQLLDGVHLQVRPDDAAQVDNLAVVIVVLFAFGIARAWEFVGADNPTLVGAATAIGRAPRPDREPDEETSGVEPGASGSAQDVTR